MAIERRKNGVVWLDKEDCIGCQACVGFCPINAMRKSKTRIEPFKCISCGACIRACPEKALEFIEKDIDEKFRNVTEAYATSDENLARELMQQHQDVSKWCDSVITELMTNPPEDISARHAVVLAMYIRYLKRISAHLTNIVSSVVNPFPRIGFRHKGKK